MVFPGRSDRIVGLLASPHAAINGGRPGKGSAVSSDFEARRGWHSTWLPRSHDFHMHNVRTGPASNAPPSSGPRSVSAAKHASRSGPTICWAAIPESTRSDSSFQTIQASPTISCGATTSCNLKGNAERRNLINTSRRFKHRSQPTQRSSSATDFPSPEIQASKPATTKPVSLVCQFKV